METQPECRCCADNIERKGRRGFETPCRLLVVNGANVCPRCDEVIAWPTIKTGTADVIGL